MSVQDRSRSLLSHKNPFGFPAEKIAGSPIVSPPESRQYILRMMVRTPESNGFQVPDELEWLRATIEFCDAEQRRLGISNLYVYITVRNGLVESTTDDLWHVDGFSMRVPHIPEQNYIFASSHGTEVLEQGISIPEGFDPMVHNIHLYFQDVADSTKVVVLDDSTLYRIDPYVIHKRPRVPEGVFRTFFRISFIPIEIEDDTCTINPMIPRLRPYGRGDVRNILRRYVP